MTSIIVAIAGRPNTGKSTLLNRLVGERKAITSLLPGTTRDRLYASTSWRGHELTLVDMGGFEAAPTSTLQQEMKGQIEVGLAEADMILFLVDAHDGVIPSDLETADVLRRSQKPVLLVVNKVDNSKYLDQLHQFYDLGMGDPIPISAYHGQGIEDLLNKTVEGLPPPLPPPEEPEELMKVAIIGRPNAGKSMLLNTILGEKRAIVNEAPGTTRDALDTLLHYDSEKVLLIDTAGIRRRGRIQKGIEQHSVLRVLQAIERTDIALLVTDAVEGITAQDTHILGYVQEAHKGAAIIVNKWDLIEMKEEMKWAEAIRQRIKFMPHIPILFTSAKTGFGTEEILPTAQRIYAERLKRLPSALLDSVVTDAITAHPPLVAKGKKRLRLLRATQTGVNPPTFVFLVNDAKLVHFSYRRYLENKLRQSFGFQGTCLHLQFRSRGKKQKA